MVHRLALTTAVATFVLILFGGLVTNTGSALAVPDWPTTFGYNMFLYPWSQMVGGVFYEHSHRLLGSIVGLLTIALAVAMWRAGGRLRWLGVVAVAAVVAQGVLGGLRVVLLKDTLAIVHGCLAQAFFALAVAVSLLTSSRHRRPVQGIDRVLRTLTFVATALVYLQIVFGALLTHAGYISIHIAGAMVVYCFVPVVTARLRRTGDPIGVPAARALLLLLGVQLLLGAGAFISRFTPVWIPGGQLTMLLLPVSHRLVGSLILASVVIASVRVTAKSSPTARAIERLTRPELRVVHR